MMETKTCIFCNKDFQAFLSTQKYCSRTCCNSFHNSRREKHIKEICCSICSDKFTPDHYKIVTCNKCRSTRTATKVRNHGPALVMPPTKAFQMNMGHVTKVPSNIISQDEALAMSPSTATEYRIKIGKGYVYPRTESRYLELLKQYPQ